MPASFMGGGQQNPYSCIRFQIEQKQRKTRMRKFTFITLVAAALVTSLTPAQARVSSETLKSLSAPDSVETRIGRLDFRGGERRDGPESLRHA
jgi:hypothetical protein